MLREHWQLAEQNARRYEIVTKSRRLMNTPQALEGMVARKRLDWKSGYVRFLPGVDGSELARAFFTFAALVGAAMCSAFECGSHDRWP